MAASSIKTVDEYIKKQKSPQRKILRFLRKLILKTAKGINEEIKMGVPWYEGKFYLVGQKDHVNMGFAYTSMLAKHQKELIGKGQYMRHIKFYKTSDINAKLLTTLVKATTKSYQNPHPKK